MTPILVNAIQEESLFNYGQILNHPKVSETAPGRITDILKLLAYGEYRDLPSVTFPVEEVIVNKLRQLTILTHIKEFGFVGVSIDELIERTGVDGDLAMIQLLLTAENNGLFRVRIDERNRTVDVVECNMWRDVHPSEIPRLASSLDHIADRIKEVLAECVDPDSQLNSINSLLQRSWRPRSTVTKP